MPRKSYAVPIDSSLRPVLYLSSGLMYYGMINPNFSLPIHLKATAIACTVLVCLCCGVKVMYLATSEQNPSSVQASRSASSMRREIGYGWYTLRLALLCLGYATSLATLFYLTVKGLGMNNHLPPIQDILLSASLTAGINTIGILLQSLALDIYYRRQEAQ